MLCCLQLIVWFNVYISVMVTETKAVSHGNPLEIKYK